MTSYGYLDYFGRVYGMSSADRKKRSDYFLNICLEKPRRRSGNTKGNETEAGVGAR
jgi:hypothetical protein